MFLLYKIIRIFTPMGRKPDINFLEKLAKANGKFKLVSNYVNQITDIIVSDELGIEYKTKPRDILRGINPSLRSAINPSEAFALKAKSIHGDIYDYSLVVYKNSRDLVRIICKEHGEFSQKPIDHFRKCGCPKCGINRTIANLTTNHIGWTLEKWKRVGERKNANPVLYIIRIFDEFESFIKIGKTYNGINNRFKNNSWNLPYCFEVIKIIEGSYEDVYLQEIKMIKDLSMYKYAPCKDFNGKTECFNMDVLKILL